MKSGLSLVEAAVYGLALTISLTVALAQSRFWKHVVDLSTLLPARYVDLLALLPMSTNTALAFVIIGAMVAGSLLVLQHPAVGLAATTGLVLATAAYPFGLLRWHRVFLALPSDESTPGVTFWVTATIPVLLLIVAPVLLQIRGLVARYREKGVEAHELRLAQTHLARLAVQSTLVALAFSAGMAVVLYGVVGTFGQGSTWIADHSVLVMVVIAALLVAAIGVGTGVFQRRRDGEPNEARSMGPPP